MSVCMLYTGNTKQEALEKANVNLDLINEKCQEICGQNWAIAPMQAINEPEIEGIIYYYFFQKPYPIFMNNAISDLEAEFDSSWIIQEI